MCRVICICENCGKEDDLFPSDAGGKDDWCSDCMKLTGLCLSCSCDIREVVEDYYNYEESQCQKCLKKTTQFNIITK